MLEIIREAIEVHKKTIGLNFKIDELLINEIDDLLNAVLKRRYRKYSFYKPYTYIKFNKKMELQSISCSNTTFFGSRDIMLYGIDEKLRKNSISSDIYFEPKKDKELYELNIKLEEVNNQILDQIVSFKKGNLFYEEVFEKESNSKTANSKVINELNKTTEEYGLLKKTKKKIDIFFDKTTTNIYFDHIINGYDYIEIGVYGKCEQYIDVDLCCINRSIYYIGVLKYIPETNRFSFDAAIKNQKYFNSKNTTINFMRNTFKKHLVNMAKGKK